nr:hypothetical protein [uncultured Prevotella sp.]
MAHFAKHRKKMKVLAMADESTFDGQRKYLRCPSQVILKGLMQIFNAISAKNLLIQVFYFLYGYPLTCCKWGSLSL